MPVNVVWIASAVGKDNAAVGCRQKSGSDLEDPHSRGITVGVESQGAVNCDAGVEFENAGKESHTS